MLIAGGGVAALEATLALGALAGELVRVELLAPNRHFYYRPLAVAEPFAAGQPYAFELRRLADEAGAQLSVGRLSSVDLDRRVARTAEGAEIGFDALVLACGALSQPALDGALCFRGFEDVEPIRALLDDLERGAIHQLAFVLPHGGGWPLPLYELALQTAQHLARHGRVDAQLSLVTHEREPLALLGKAATSALGQMLADLNIRVLTGRRATAFAGGELELTPGPSLKAEAVVSLPKLAGPFISGVPADGDGFIATDEFGRVRGLYDVFAAGDMTAFPIKQGGLAAQAADAVAEAIAAHAGATLQPTPFVPILRGLLLTGGTPTFIRSELRGNGSDRSVVSGEPLWWPPAKIVGRYLAPLLAQSLRYAETAPPAGGIPVNVDLTTA